MPRPKKKPDFDPQTIMDEFFTAVSSSYHSPSADEAVDGHKKMELVADEFSISRLKVRKILITTGDYSTSDTRRAAELRREGMKTSEIAQAMHLAPCTVTSLLPYEKTAYKLEELSVAAERVKLYRERKEAVEVLQAEKSSVALWKAIIAFQAYPFTTSERGERPGVKFKYTVAEQPGRGGKQYEGESVDGYGNELFIAGREKSITRSSVDYAFRIIEEKREAGEVITGPKQLKVYGSSYIYAIFKRFWLV